MLSGFKQFILRGNVVDLAVGVVIGAAFGTVVTSFTKAFLTPLIALFVGTLGKAEGGKAEFSNLAFTIGTQSFPIGEFINSVISFLLIAAAVYFFVVTPINALVSRIRKAPAPVDPTTKKCPECLSEIPIDARRCAHCAQPVTLGAAAD
jgi:large conductance mechanosensitive channel